MKTAGVKLTALAVVFSTLAISPIRADSINAQDSRTRLDTVVVNFEKFLEQYEFEGPGAAVTVELLSTGAYQAARYEGSVRRRVVLAIAEPSSASYVLTVTIPRLGGSDLTDSATIGVDPRRGVNRSATVRVNATGDLITP